MQQEKIKRVAEYWDPAVKDNLIEVGRKKVAEIESAPLANKPSATKVRGKSID